MFAKIPVRPLLQVLVGAVGVMALVAVGGTAAAANGIFVPAGYESGPATGSAAPSGSNQPGSVHWDWDGNGRWDWDRDGRDGDDGDDGEDGKDGETRTEYVTRYKTEYLTGGGDTGRVSDGGQVAIYPSGGVDTGRA